MCVCVCLCACVRGPNRLPGKRPQRRYAQRSCGCRTCRHERRAGLRTPARPPGRLCNCRGEMTPLARLARTGAAPCAARAVAVEPSSFSACVSVCEMFPPQTASLTRRWVRTARTCAMLAHSHTVDGVHLGAQIGPNAVNQC